MTSPADKPLPPFREDLQLYQGPDDPDGSPTFNIFDPVKRQYYKISWGESLIIKNLKPGMTASELSDSINAQTTINVTPDEVIAYFQDAGKHNLLSLPRTSSFVQKEADRGKQGLLKWLAMHYLYIRVPLFDPDEFLNRTLKYVKPLASTTAFLIYGFISLIGLGYLFVHMEEFFHTFLYFFTIEGFVTYALALTAVKIIHEFAHAYTAVNFKVRVPVMGVIFLVMWPVLFTDVTDGWRLKNRRHRLYISLAGIIVETTIAGLCTFGWALSQPGLLKSVFFVVSSASWLSTLLVNANPMMRFDGYYIFSDLWGIDNLQTRAFATARWRFRSLFLGLETPCPVQGYTQKRIHGMIIYAVCTWIYRLILYTTIAIFVYHSFTKTVGIILFFVEIQYFIVGPIISEIKSLFVMRKNLVSPRKLILFCGILAIAVFYLSYPFPRTKRFPAITVAAEEQVVYVPEDSVVQEIDVSRNRMVSKNSPLVKLRSQKLESEYKKYTAEAKMIQQQIKIMGLDAKDAPQIPEKAKELEGTLAKRKAIEQKLNSLVLRASMDGSAILWDENLKVDQAVSKDQVLGKLADLGKVKVVCFVPEELLNEIHEGQEVLFILASDGLRYPGKIESINPVRARRLLYPALASVYHGPLPVAEDTASNLILIESYFPVMAVLEGEEKGLRYGQAGYLRVEGIRSSIAAEIFREAGNILWRESGF